MATSRGETPTISSSAMSASASSPLELLSASGMSFGSVPPAHSADTLKMNAAVAKLIGRQRVGRAHGNEYGFQAEPEDFEVEASEVNQPGDQVAMRIVKVYIADVNENVPLASRIIYEGKEKLTDLTDQELFFDANITELLGKHNAEVRAKTVDKAASQKFGRDIFLEPAKIRDLKMVVVEVAKF